MTAPRRASRWFGRDVSRTAAAVVRGLLVVALVAFVAWPERHSEVYEYGRRECPEGPGCLRGELFIGSMVGRVVTCEHRRRLVRDSSVYALLPFLRPQVDITWTNESP